MKNNFQKRIEYQGNLRSVFEDVCQQYALGNFITFNIIKSGYEDFNIKLKTSEGDFFVKIFNKHRERWEAKRCVEIISRVFSSGINFPKVFKNSKGFFYEKKFNDVSVRLCLMEYVNGKSFFALRIEPFLKEARLIVQQAVKINKLQLKPKFVYDSWATTNVLKEYQKKKKYLDNLHSKLNCNT